MEAALTACVTAPRIIVAGATTAVTRRCTMRKAFLGPWHPGVEQAWLYSLALAQQHTGVAIHHGVRVVNHHHLTVTPEHDNLPRFLAIAHHELSCAINTLLAWERYDQPGELFDGRATHLMRLGDDAAQSTQLLYEYLNPVAAGLVRHPEHMPGLTLDFDLWLRGGLDVERPAFYFSDKQPPVLRLHVTPPPLLYLAFGGDMDKLVYSMKRLAEQGARELRSCRTRPVVGARALMRLHPWSEPRTLRETRGKRVPSFRIGARGIVGRQAHIEAALETRRFRDNYRECRLARKAGDFEQVFPCGTYQLRVVHGVPVAEPELGTGLLTRPGPTLRDVQGMLAQRAERGLEPPAAEARLELVDRAREAVLHEAAELCEQASDGMDFKSPTGGQQATRPPAAEPPQQGGEELGDRQGRPAAVVGHRFGKRPEGGAGGPQRVVTLRDRRRGRPKGSRHGSDPPA